MKNGAGKKRVRAARRGLRFVTGSAKKTTNHARLFRFLDFYLPATAPTQIGVVVGCGLPPAGSSVMAKALVPFGESGGFATSRSNVPSASGRSVIEGIGLAPGALGISHNCSVRFPDGIGSFCPETTIPME